jgi:hypothetical protein
MSWMKWLGLFVVVLALAWAVLGAFGTTRWAEATRALAAQLEAARLAPAVDRYDPKELDGLPAPVQRYFRAVLRDGQPVVTAASVLHAGRFNMAPQGEAWKPFTSTQQVVTRRPGFVWDGKVDMLPGLPVRVHDAYVAGTGILRPAILGLFTLVDMRGGGEIARGELLRFFAEAAWYPTALLPSQGVRWEPLDAHSARATLSDGAVVVTLSFVFTDEGLIDSVRADARGYAKGKEIVPMPWEGRWSNWQLRDGMRVPMTGEVAWLLPQGRQPYWRGTITSLRYRFAP